MAFVNEAVPDEQKSKFDPKVFFNPTQLNQPIRPYRWTIDRERDTFLIRLGGGGREPEIPFLYALSLKGKVIKFEAVQSAKGNSKDGLIIDWCVTNVRTPPELEGELEGVQQMLREGLDAMGDRTCNRPDYVIAVNINFQ